MSFNILYSHWMVLYASNTAHKTNINITACDTNTIVRINFFNTLCATATAYSQSSKNSIDMSRNQWVAIATVSPLTAHKEVSLSLISPKPSNTPTITTWFILRDSVSTSVAKAHTELQGDNVGHTKLYSVTKSSVVSVEPDSKNGDPSILDSNTTYILVAVGGALAVIAVTLILLGIVYVCRNRQRRAEERHLKQSNTRRSSNASDFIYSSAYEWTCRQTRLLTHLRPDTTGYQSHWSLTRDVSRKSSLQSSNQQKEAIVAQPENSPKTEVTKSAERGPMDSMSANSSTVETVHKCTVIETHYTPAGLPGEVEEKSMNGRSHSDADTVSQPHTEQNQGSLHNQSSQPHHSNYFMYRNPLYARRKEQSKKRERKRGERSRNWKVRPENGEIHRGEGREENMAREGKIEKVRKDEKSEDFFIPQNPLSTTSLIAPTEPLSSFLLSDSEAYDSGNASAVSTDCSACTVPTDVQRNQCNATEKGGIIECNSFE